LSREPAFQGSFASERGRLVLSSALRPVGRPLSALLFSLLFFDDDHSDRPYDSGLLASARGPLLFVME
jgi:hypothetical protein